MPDAAATNFLKAGETAELIRSFDWASTTLGPIDSWPPSLKVATGLLLQSPVPLVMLWGEDGYMIYNDAYSVFAGGRHPRLLGSKVREGWPEVADFNDNVMRVGLAGGTLHYRDQELVLHRSGRPEPVWMNLDYSPVLGEDGEPAGVIAVVVETTERVLAERRAAAASARLRRQFEQAPGFVIIMSGPQHVVEFVNEAHRKLFGSEDWVGQAIREAFPSLAETGFFEVLDTVFSTGEPFQAEDAEVSFRRSPGEPVAHHFLSFIYSPVIDGDGRITGVFCDGYDVTASRQATRALRESEARLRFLDHLATQTAASLDADEILATTTRLTAEHLGASNCAYADMDEDEDGFTIRGDWSAPGSPSIVGRYRLADFGHLAVQELGAGRPLIVNDNLRELAPHEAEAFQALGISATICMPLVKKGRLTALMAVHHSAPHAWTADELATIRDVTDRSWAHVERAAAAVELRENARALRDLNAELERRVEERTRQLRESEEFMRLALSAVGGVGVWTYDVAADRVIFDANVAQLYGHSAEAGPEGMTRALFLQHLHPDDRARFLDGAPHRLSSRDDQEAEYRIVAPDGSTRWVLSRGRTSFAEDGRAVRRSGVAIDVTQQRLLEEQLRQSQKMEAVGQLTGGIAHDFNNLLTGVSGSLEMAQTRLAQGRADALGRYLDSAQGAARRAAALTHRLLAFSRRQTLDPQPTDVNRLVSDMEELIRRTVGPAVTIEVVPAASLWPVSVDQNQLENTLLNLCINARDAMPEGGRITISTANASLDGRSAAEEGLPPGDYVSLRVADEGAGMSDEVKARAFDPFFTTKPIGQGTGLGLSMIYGFMRQSGGQIRILSEPGEGAILLLYLPRHEASPDPGPSPRRPRQQPQRGAGETVLVIDDELTIRMLIAEVLEDAGYAGIEAADGPAGLKILESDARIDLLITDVGLPGGMNGRQVADAARVLRPNLKVLFITGYAETAAVGAGHLDPGMGVLTKPFAIEELAQRIRGMIEA